MATYYVELNGGDIAPKTELVGGVITPSVSFSGAQIYPTSGGGGTVTLQTKSVTYTPSTSQQTEQVTPDQGYDGLDKVNVTVDAVASGSVAVDTKTITVTSPFSFNATTGKISSHILNTVQGTATVTPGYVDSATPGDIHVYTNKDQQLDLVGATTYYPSTSDQTIATQQYLTGAQTIKGVTYSGLDASNIKKDVVVQVGDSADPDRIVSVTGTYEGGGGGGYTNNDFADLSKPIGEVMTTLASLPPYFFYNRTGITKFTGNNVTTLESPNYAYCHTFYGCTALQEVVLPNVTQLSDKNSVFRNCTSLRKVDLSSVKTTNSTSCFQNDSQLEGIVFPSALSAAGNAGTTLGNNMFNGCTSLAYFDSAMVYNIQAATFTNCASLSVVVIRYSPNTNAGNISALANVSAFNGTPFASGGSGGTLYVPSDKISAYQAATNWSTILGYANNQIKAIEGSYYETHWADGTVIS